MSPKGPDDHTVDHKVMAVDAARARAEQKGDDAIVDLRGLILARKARALQKSLFPWECMAAEQCSCGASNDKAHPDQRRASIPCAGPVRCIWLALRTTSLNRRIWQPRCRSDS